MKMIIGVDNGVTGGITIISDDVIHHIKTPIKKELSYTKAKQWINRVDYLPMKRFLFNNSYNSQGEWGRPLCLLERPMVNPGRFKATVSALRCLEATLIIMEQLTISVQYIDSKEWQKVMLPSGLKGADELKAAAKSVARRLFPDVKIVNADSLLIAEYGRRKYTLGDNSG